MPKSIQKQLLKKLKKKIQRNLNNSKKKKTNQLRPVYDAMDLSSNLDVTISVMYREKYEVPCVSIHACSIARDRPNITVANILLKRNSFSELRVVVF